LICQCVCLRPTCGCLCCLPAWHCCAMPHPCDHMHGMIITLDAKPSNSWTETHHHRLGGSSVCWTGCELGTCSSATDSFLCGNAADQQPIQPTPHCLLHFLAATTSMNVTCSGSTSRDAMPIITSLGAPTSAVHVSHECAVAWDHKGLFSGRLLQLCTLHLPCKI
jgi:hypothetical protein